MSKIVFNHLSGRTTGVLVARLVVLGSRLWPSAILPLLIFAISFLVFFPLRSFGTVGDDAAGYLNIASNLADGRFVVEDAIIPIVAHLVPPDALHSFLPSHYNPIGAAPEVARPKYLLGLPLMLAIGEVLFGPTGPFLVVPLVSALAIVAVYYAARALFWGEEHRTIIAVVAVLLFALNPLIFIRFISQPMTEIPSVAFLLLSLAGLVTGLRAGRPLFVGLAGASFGYAMDLRETNVIFAVPLAIVFFDWWRRTRQNNPYRLVRRQHLIFALWFAGGTLATLSLTLVTAAVATGNPVSIARFHEAGGLSLRHWFHNPGVYEAGRGSMRVYAELVLLKLLPVPFLWLIATYAIDAVFRKSVAVAVAIVVWLRIPILFFSLWINPYDRYLIPALPAAFLLLAFGIVELAVVLVKRFPPLVRRIAPAHQGLAAMVLVAVMVAAVVGPEVGTLNDYMFGERRYISEIRREDFENIRRIREMATGEKAVLLYAGAMPESRGNIEATTKMRVINISHHTIARSSVTGFTDAEVLGDVVLALLDEEYDVLLWKDASTPLTQVNALTSRFGHEDVGRVTLTYDYPGDILRLTAS